MHRYRRTLLKAMSAAMPLAIAAGAGLFRSTSALAAHVAGPCARYASAGQIGGCKTPA